MTVEDARQAVNFSVNRDYNQDSKSFQIFARTLGIDVTVDRMDGVNDAKEDRIRDEDTNRRSDRREESNREAQGSVGFTSNTTVDDFSKLGRTIVQHE